MSESEYKSKDATYAEDTQVPQVGSTIGATAESQALQRRRQEEQIRATINRKLEESGERERIEELLRTKLIECGWRDELKHFCKEVVKNKGLEKISVEELVAEITPRGRATVPDSIKAELLNRIRKFLQTN
mmetsp:Transcript_2896/g.3665  ORF Transcript_2896/g.3665 Transcript_2896/m.3665 type:complete len:131 (-) Transcript_2896:1698-2090(-)